MNNKSTLTLRPYQKECIETVNSLPNGSRSIVSMATGLGKTVCMANFERNNGRMLIISHRDELVRQPEKYFDCSFGIEKADECAKETDEVVSASVQSLCKDSRLHRYKPDSFELVVVDEAHHAEAKTYKKILDYFKPKKLIGLTATPKRNDGQSLSDVFDSICYSRSLLWGIKNGYLCKIRGTIATAKGIDISRVSMTAGDFSISELESKLTPEYYITARDVYEQDGGHEKYSTLIYCINLRACNIMADMLRENLPEEKQKEIQIITGETSADERHEIEREFLQGKVRCIINCMVLTEGSDLPITSRIIICRPTCNNLLYTQICGRGTRLSEGKDSCLIVDVIPQKIKRICSIASLVDEDIAALPRSMRTSLFEKMPDLETIEEEIRRIREQQEDYARPLIEQYEIFEELVQKETEEIREAVETAEGSGEEFVQKLYGTEKFVTGKYFAEYGLRYSITPFRDTRFRIQALPMAEFVISEPNIIGNVNIKAVINGEAYASHDVSFNKAAQLIRQILDSIKPLPEYTWNTWMWEGEEATDSQKRFLNTQLKRSGIKGIDRINFESLGKQEASICIDYLVAAAEHRKKLKDLKKDKKALEKSMKEGDLSEEETGSEPKEKESKSSNERDFMELAQTYKDVEIRKPGKQETADPGEKESAIKIEWTIRKNIYYLEEPERPASDRQREFAKSLYSDCKNIPGVYLKGDVIQVCDSERGASVSAAIDLLKCLKDKIYYFRKKHKEILIDITSGVEVMKDVNPLKDTDMIVNVYFDDAISEEDKQNLTDSGEEEKQDSTEGSMSADLYLYNVTNTLPKGKYIIYTDGGCERNPFGAGGTGSVIIDEAGTRYEIAAGYKKATNNRMEIMAAINALRAVEEGSKIELFSDSQYVIATMNRQFSMNKNKDLWKELVTLSRKRTVAWSWVHGHDGNKENERCDELAKLSMKKVSHCGR